MFKLYPNWLGLGWGSGRHVCRHAREEAEAVSLAFLSMDSGRSSELLFCLRCSPCTRVVSTQLVARPFLASDAAPLWRWLWRRWSLRGRSHSAAAPPDDDDDDDDDGFQPGLPAVLTAKMLRQRSGCGRGGQKFRPLWCLVSLSAARAPVWLACLPARRCRPRPLPLLVTQNANPIG